MYAERRRELLNLILVVLIFGTLSSILTSFFFTVPSAASYFPWVVAVVLLVAVASTYTLVLIPAVVEAAIYANILIDVRTHQLYESRFAPPASQIAALLFRGLSQEDKGMSDELIQELDRSDNIPLALDFLEYLVFIAISGFDPFWASPRVQSFGRPTWSGRPLGEKLSYRPTSVLTLRKVNDQNDNKNSDGFPIIDISGQFQNNQIVTHFRGATKLDIIYQPTNWMVWVPKRVRLTIARDGNRTILFSDCYAKLTVTLSRAAVGMGLPYGVCNKESEYNEFNFSTSDFRLDFRFELRTIGRIASFLPVIDSYMNWSDKIMRNLVGAFVIKD